jgi:hypothetical protein
LQRGLDSRYRSVQAHCARSLGSLGDQSLVPVLLERLAHEPDLGLQLAFASVLGKLGAEEAIPLLLDLLGKAELDDARGEYSLALARLVGNEHDYIQLQRRVREEPGTSLSQAVSRLRDDLPSGQEPESELSMALDSAAETLAQDDLLEGMFELARALGLFLGQLPPRACRPLLAECASYLDSHGWDREEYAVLALHALHSLSTDQDWRSWLAV